MIIIVTPAHAVDPATCVYNHKYCTSTGYGNCGAESTNKEDACEKGAQNYADSNVNYNYVGYLYTGTCKAQYNYVGTATVSENTLYLHSTLVGCEDDDVCLAQAGSVKAIRAASIQEVDTYCDNNCSYTSTGNQSFVNGEFISTYTTGGGYCNEDFEDGGWSGGIPASEDAPQNGQGNPEACSITSANGQYCMIHAPQNQNCGEYNGVDICVPDLPTTGNCHFLANLAYACETSAPTQDRPQNESQEVAVPDVDYDIDGNQGQIYDYDTMAASSNIAVPSGSGVPAGWQGGDPNGSGGTGGSAEIANAGEIGEAVADSLDEKAEEEAASLSDITVTGDGSRMSQIHSDFNTALNNTAVITMFSNMALQVPENPTCPTYTFNIFGTSIVVDLHCSLIASTAAVLSPIFLLGYVLLGIRIVGSA